MPRKVHLVYLDQLAEQLDAAAQILRAAKPDNPSPEQAHQRMRDAGIELAKAAVAVKNLRAELEGVLEDLDSSD